MLTAIIADDLTGAADTGVQFARAGYRTAVVFRGELEAVKVGSRTIVTLASIEALMAAAPRLAA